METEAKDLTTYLAYNRAMDPDMASDSTTCLCNTFALG